MDLDSILSKVPNYSQELGLDLNNAHDRFKWFLAATLFAKRISAEIAKKTFRKFVKERLTTPEKIIEAGWDRLVQVLDSGGYARYDFSTATNLLNVMSQIKEEYSSLEELHRVSADPKDLESRLKKLKGLGPVGVNIFLRELRGIWEKADPPPSKLAVQVGEKLGLKNVKAYESALVRVYLEFCKRGKCEKCFTRNLCRDRR